tara:strand:+ start:2348 stop:3055 length:708 start_codon:yes stop_codon:yes gene_type:complete
MADLANAIRVKFLEEYNKNYSANETVWSLIESDGKQEDGSKIVPQMGRHTWDEVMLQPYVRQHQNEWAHEAMVLINWMSPDELVANVNRKGGYSLNGNGPWLGMSALHWGVELGFSCVVKALLNIPEIDINIQDVYGRTPLQLAFTGKGYNVKIVTALIEHGADFNVQDDKGDTPLHTSILFHGDFHSEWLPLMIMDHLVDYNYNQVDEEGKNLLQRAQSWNRSESIIKKIQSNM